jgi:hypothetical protein
VKYPTKGNLVQYFPYSTVRVIDNRLDTTKIYTRETGIYPPHHVNFNEPAAAVIKKYIDSAVRDSKKGAGELTAEGLRHNYRYCTLNMDNGDILYNDK